MLHERLDAVLENLAHDEAYRVVSTMGSSVHETTEAVMRANPSGGESGPFVRKRFSAGKGLGRAYRDLWRAQQEGMRFEHLPRVVECYELAGEEVVVLEYVRGITLHEVVYRCDASPELAVRYFPLVCDAVSELHTAFDPPMIHRDLKPSNIVVSMDDAANQGVLTLIDLGIARTYKAEATSDTTHFGTRAYAPPEQFGFGQTDHRSDQYALGMILYYLLTEEVPVPELAGGTFDDERIPPAFRPVLARATAFDPKQRFADVRELKAAFMAVIPDNPMGSVPAHQDLSTRIAPQRPVKCGPINGFHDVVGILWNVVLFLAWLLIVAGSVFATVQPTEAMARVPMPLRATEYAVLTLAIGGVAFMLASKAPFAKRVRALSRFSFRKGLKTGGIFTAALLGLFVGLLVLQIALIGP